MISEQRVDEWFTLVTPTDEDLEVFAEINECARELVLCILRTTPPSPDQSTAIRKVREAVMTACQSRLTR